MKVNRVASALFLVGDYAAGAVIGALTAAAVHAAVYEGMDMVLAVLLGVAIGMVVHAVVGVLFAPLVGAFHVMFPGGLIGMYGGMLFAMREAMQARVPLQRSIEIGAIFGIVVIAAVHVYDRALRAGSGV